MTVRQQKLVDELAAIRAERGGLDPAYCVQWARERPDSELHARLQWDDAAAGEAHRIWQMRQIIVEVKVTYEDKRERQVYVSVTEDRGTVGYVPLVEVMSDKEKRARFLAQVLDEYERLGRKYEDLAELAGIKSAVAAARRKLSAKKRAA